MELISQLKELLKVCEIKFTRPHFIFSKYWKLLSLANWIFKDPQDRSTDIKSTLTIERKRINSIKDISSSSLKVETWKKKENHKNKY